MRFQTFRKARWWWWCRIGETRRYSVLRASVRKYLFSYSAIRPSLTTRELPSRIWPPPSTPFQPRWTCLWSPRSSGVSSPTRCAPEIASTTRRPFKNPMSQCASYSGLLLERMRRRRKIIPQIQTSGSTGRISCLQIRPKNSQSTQWLQQMNSDCAKIGQSELRCSCGTL